jgi:hypothetical protein
VEFEKDSSKTPSSYVQLHALEDFLNAHMNQTVFLDVEVLDADFVFEAEEDPMHKLFGETAEYKVVYTADVYRESYCEQPNARTHGCEDQTFWEYSFTGSHRTHVQIQGSWYVGVAIAVERNRWQGSQFPTEGGVVVLHGNFVPGEVPATKDISMTPYWLTPVGDEPG